MGLGTPYLSLNVDSVGERGATTVAQDASLAKPNLGSSA